jgi:integrase
MAKCVALTPQSGRVAAVRFHDGRHTALMRLAQKGVPDWVIRAQFGHVSPAMMAVYSQVEFPGKIGAPCKTRTCDLLVRSRKRRR